MNSINKIAKESSINFSGSVLGNVLGYVWLMFMTRYLSQDDFGSFTLAQSIINVSMIFVLLGTHRSLDRFIPVFNASGETGKVKSLIRIILQIVILTNIIVCLVLYLGTDFLSVKVFSNPTLSAILPVTILTIPLLAITMIVGYAFSGYKELRYHVYLKQIIEPGLKIIFAITVAVFSLGVIQWTWLYLAALLITAAVAVWLLATRIIKPLADVVSQKNNVWEILSYSWPISISSILIIIIGQIDYLILGIYHPAANVGIYRIYIQIIVLLKLILGSMARIYKPVISELIPEGKFQEIKDTYRKVSKWVLASTTLGLVVIILYGNRLTSLLFTDAYAVYPLALIILAVGTYLNSTFGPEGMTLEAFGNTKLIMMNSLISLSVNVGLGFLLIPDYGILGAAIATGVTLTIGGILGFLEIYILYKMQPFSRNSLKFILVGTITGLVFFYFDRWLMINNVLFLVISILLLIGFYSLGIILSGSLDDEDKEIIQNLFKRIQNGFAK